MRIVYGVLLMTMVAAAQTASVTGRITDPSGGVVPGVDVTVESAGTGGKATTQTTAEGYYTLPSLKPGVYHVYVNKTGFKPVRDRNLTLTVQQVARLDFTLEVGSVSESVEVSARGVLLESESSTLGQLVQSRQITELPLLGRNPYALAMLVAGVRPASGNNDLPVNQIGTAFASVNGQRGNANEYLLDGAPNSSPAQNQPVIFASVDAVQEFKVETNNFSAEYGRAAGGVFNVVTKSGTNDLHFAAYEFLRNDALNANNFFANRAGQATPPFKFNQFGVALGGPVILPKVYNGRNRTFFFVNTELVRWISGVTLNGTTPTDAQRAGDFSATRNAAGQPINIYDPLSTRAAAGGFVRDLFPGNRIPADRIDPVARNIARLWPAPNTPGNAVTGANNWVSNVGDNTQKNTFSVRGDQYFTAQNRAFARISYDDSPVATAPAFGKDNIASNRVAYTIFQRRNAVAEDSHTFSPRLLGTFRYSFARLANRRNSFSEGIDITTLGYPASLAQQLATMPLFPAISVTGILGLGQTGLIHEGTSTHALSGMLTQSLSRHILKAGAEFRVIQFNNQQNGAANPGFSAVNSWTQGPNPSAASATAGFAFASFLVGSVGGSVSPPAAVAQQNKYYAAYVQDDFKVTPTLTVNLGLRYEYETPRTDRFNQLTNFDSTLRPPLSAPGLDLHGALTFVGVGGNSRYQSNPDRNNIGPRAGFAWRLGSKMVMRGGGGLFYATNTGVGTTSDVFGVSGFQATTNVVTSLDGVTPIAFLRNPYPNGILQPTGSKLGPATLLGQSVAFYDRNNRIPYSEQWNFNLQRELPGSILFDIGYAGSHGLKFSQDRTLNQLPDSALAQTNNLRTQVANPFVGQINSGILAQTTVSRAQLLRPYPQFDGVTSVLANWASSSYNGLEIRAEKRAGKGVTALASYTWSKLMDYASGAFSGESLGADAIQNWNNLRAERSVSALDQTHRLIASVVYELPFGKAMHGTLGKAVAGWQVSTIVSRFSGPPLAVNATVNNTFAQGGGQRPNWSGVNPSLDDRSVDRWFNTSVFTNAAPFTFGNAPRTYSGLRGHGVGNLDFSLHKNTRIAEKLNLQFRAEFFNLMNHPQFAPPNANLGAAQFGTVTAQANQPRIVQLALKLTY